VAAQRCVDGMREGDARNDISAEKGFKDHPLAERDRRLPDDR
jgi:hypothetical protein